ncbi:hypothetical protein Ahy_A01g002372 isoform A [Arachis hypogaea]|uniref:SAP domain-containing protein n=1 Tax=Arachis hypogaea TaxID=3818 RepID=A0A445EQY1_ARAHY|nr:hypothetical protein Ahy_A01g002372 isoform A [Arachis hypogaea]
MDKLVGNESLIPGLKFLLGFIEIVLSDCKSSKTSLQITTKKCSSSSSLEIGHVSARSVGSRKNPNTFILSANQKGRSTSLKCDAISVDEDEDDATSDGKVLSIDKEDEEDASSERTWRVQLRSISVYQHHKLILRGSSELKLSLQFDSEGFLLLLCCVGFVLVFNSMVMDTNRSSGASSFLSDLPSRGLFSSTVVSSNPGGMRVYVCDHETMPPGLLILYLIVLNRVKIGSLSSTNIILYHIQMRFSNSLVDPEGQHIKTNQQNILIRALTLGLKKQKCDSSSKDGTEGSRKRASDKGLDGRASAKRANNQINSLQGGLPLEFTSEGSTSQTFNKDFHRLTVERLRNLLKSKGLSTKGKKASISAVF